MSTIIEKEEENKSNKLNDPWSFWFSLRGKKAVYNSDQYESNLTLVGKIEKK